MNANRILLVILLACLPASALALTFSQGPLFLASTEARIMLLLSRDHELSRKAYTDYSDLNNDGSLDTTYNDTVTYYGYFNPNRCYSYGTGRFEPEGIATGLAAPQNHQCSGQWSGNFLNWATMTRLDVVRKVLYGGFRSTDSAGTALGTTVLERAFLPPDVHSFAKVYAPAGGATDVARFTPYSQAAITLCNVTDMGTGVQAGSINTVNNIPTATPPLIKVASGSWPQWAMTEILQCQWKEDFAEASPTRPTKATERLTGSSDLIARVAVCVPGKLEDKCKSYYSRATSPVETVKPTGLLQQYGDVDAERRTRFGLMTGSYKKNTSGGVLRKNIKLLTNNAKTDLTNTSICGDNNPDDEIDVCTGQFINQANADNGIVDTLNRIHIAGYKTPAAGAITATNVCAGGYNNSNPYACNASSLLSPSNGTCVDWGNPLSEMYHEAMRYFAGKTSATADYATNDDGTVITGLGQATWNSSSDPLPATEWCALSNIIVLSTGLTSLDNATITTDISGLSPTSLTDAVGSSEGISGSYLIGSNGSTTNNLCSAKTLSSLSSASGICPELPHMKGGYLIAGLASANRSLDLRPSYATNRSNRWTGVNADWVARQPLGIYTVGLAENLPSFEVTVGTGKVSLVPACRSNGSTICSMTDLRVENYSATAASFLVSWEDNSAGSDYDMDTIARIQYCVGPTAAGCNDTTVGAGQIRITVSAAQSATGSGMELGYTVSGTSTDGTVFPIKIPGTASCNPSGTTGADANYFSLLTTPFSSRPASAYSSWSACPDGITKLPTGIRTATGCPSGSNCGCPKTTTYTQSSTAAGLLKNPLWYAAKYGTQATSWDLNSDDEPDNFFNVRNPANLYEALSRVFDQASQPDASAASVATNSTNLQIESRIYQARFSSADWSGQLLSYYLGNSTAISSTPEWDAGAKLVAQTPSSRVILTKGATDGVAFSYANLTTAQQGFLNQNTLGVADVCGPERVAYLRGDATNEAANGTFTCAGTGATPISKFRQRIKTLNNVSVHFKLGDTVNSNPWYVGAPSAGHSDVEHPGYSAYRTAKLNRKPVVYVGSNDGMLHGFDASLDFSSVTAGTPTTTAGQEVLAYVPSAVYPHLAKLTDRTYNRNHRYFVDGSPMVADIDINSSTTNDWRTVLVGALGAGGKGYYALDVSDPATFSETTTAAANTLLWEFNNDSDMGYVYNLPPASGATKQAKQIVKMANGKWAVILGNGYKSNTDTTSLGKAVLYIVFIEDGVDGTWSSTDYVKIVADEPAGLDNGLSTPVPFDSNEDGYVDTVYAGDLKGRLWKFLVGPKSGDTSYAGVTSTPSTWKVAFSTGSCTTAAPCTPLFNATDGGTTPLAQPIISPPEVTVHPEGGQLVMFGTGKYIEDSDRTSTSVQTFYGIWDKGSAITGTRASNLLQQTVSLSGSNFRIPSNNPITWRTAAAASCTGTCPATHMGWYLDLPTSKERTTGIPNLINQKIFFNTLIPSAEPCEAGGTGWLMALNYLNGGLVSTHPVFDTNNDGTINNSDTLVGGYKVGAAVGGTTLIPSATSDIGVGVSSLTSGNLGTALINFGGDINGRLSWREIVQ